MSDPETPSGRERAALNSPAKGSAARRRNGGNGAQSAAEGIARAEFGRFYWSGKLDRQLQSLRTQAEARIQEARREWIAAHRAKSKRVTDEFRRRIEAARSKRTME